MWTQILRSGLGCFALCMLLTRTLAAQPTPHVVSVLQVACAAEHFVGKSGGSVALHAWVTNKQGKPVKQGLAFKWKPEEGAISGAENATWTLPGVSAPKKLLAKLQVSKPGAIGNCELELFVTPPPKRIRAIRAPMDMGYGGGAAAEGAAAAMAAEAGPPQSDGDGVRGTTLRGIFVPRDPTAEDNTKFGLYSYLLIRSRAGSAAEEKRFKQILEAYLGQVENFELQSSMLAPSELNLLRVPLLSKVDLSFSSDAERSAVAAKILEKYDYIWASKLLLALDNDGREAGPFLVVSLSPTPSAGDDVLQMDMSKVTASLAVSWLRSFVWLTAQKRTWLEKTADGLGRQLSNVLSVVAQEANETVGAVFGGLLKLSKPLPQP
jgi:hypothetical protein